MKTMLPAPFNPPRPLRKVGQLARRSSQTLVVRHSPRLFAAMWFVEGGARRFLLAGAVGFMAGTLLPLLAVGGMVVGLVLGFAGVQAAAATPLPVRPRPRAVLPALRPTTQPPLPAPTPPPAQPALPIPAQPFAIEVVERDLTPTAEPSPQPLIGWPADGAITQGFGCSSYYTGIAGPGCPAETPWFHDGVDIANQAGAPVRASLAGTVVFAGADRGGPLCQGGYRGYGLAVVVDNGAGWQVLYAHLARLEVKVGQAVTPETIIGAAGETGCVSGTHLHFGLRYNGVLVDPEELRP